VTSAELGALAFTTQDSGAWYDNTFFFGRKYDNIHVDSLMRNDSIQQPI
jgi:hypothetical protein